MKIMLIKKTFLEGNAVSGGLIRMFSSAVCAAFLPVGLLVCGPICGVAKPAGEPDSRIEEIIRSMSLEEKVDQLAGLGVGTSEYGDEKSGVFGTRGNARLGVPDLIMGHGITGVRSGRDINVRSTYICAPIGIGATWDTELYERVSVAIAREMRELHQNLNLGPTLNIVRNPLGGRNWECISEDPYLIGRMIVPHTRAMQANGIISGPKHFVANDQEHERFDINNVVDERTLREIYLLPFEAAVKEGGALNIMAAYNRLNGTFMCENKRLLTDILRQEWGFRGFVLSDFSNGVRSTRGSIDAGLNIEMHSPKYYGKNLVEAVKRGEISEDRVNELLREKLSVMFAIGMFSKDYPSPKGEVRNAAHQQLAREVARKAMVLLKNEDRLLPLQAGKIKSLAVIGPNAERYADVPVTDPNFAYFLQGGGSGRTYYFNDAVVSPLAGFKANSPTGVQIRHAVGCLPPTGRKYPHAEKTNAELVSEAVATARTSDAAVVVVGLSGFLESEGEDRTSVAMPAGQTELIKAVAAVNPNTVVVVAAGSYVDMSPWIEDVRAVFFAPYCGEKMGDGLADVVWGKCNPSGKLPVTFPKSGDQYPEGSIYTGGGYSQTGKSNHYSEGIFVGYRWFDRGGANVLFPFGYGLSYTTFKYEKMEVVSAPGKVPVEVDVTVRNAGVVAGDEVVQMYVHDPISRLERPVRELKGFQRVALQPGETRKVRLVLPSSAFAYYDEKAPGWVVEPGDFDLQAGASSRDIHLVQRIHLGQ